MANLVSAALLIHFQKSKGKTVKDRGKTEQSGKKDLTEVTIHIFLPVFDSSRTYFYDRQLYFRYELLLEYFSPPPPPR